MECERPDDVREAAEAQTDSEAQAGDEAGGLAPVDGADSADSADAATLERFLLALQKTLSRVSRDSAAVPAGQARALISGPVAFDAELRCELDGEDRLGVSREGAVLLRLSGRVATDVGVRLLEADDGSQATAEMTAMASKTTRATTQTGGGHAGSHA